MKYMEVLDLWEVFEVGETKWKIDGTCQLFVTDHRAMECGTNDNSAILVPIELREKKISWGSRISRAWGESPAFSFLTSFIFQAQHLDIRNKKCNVT